VLQALLKEWQAIGVRAGPSPAFGFEANGQDNRPAAGLDGASAFEPMTLEGHGVEANLYEVAGKFRGRECLWDGRENADDAGDVAGHERLSWNFEGGGWTWALAGR
jgi:hypothetical protein